MKYRTVIELICDAADKDDAFHTAGEYLRGEVESGVDMRCKAVSLKTHRMVRCAAFCFATMFLLSTLLVGIATKEKNANLKKISDFVLSNTCTIQPVLKTKHTADFRDKWEDKKDKVMLEYLKK
jgi:hypothetical protein